MGLIKDSDRQEISKMLAGLVHDVKLLMFTQEHECQWCQTTREMVLEVAELSGKVTAEIHDFVKDAELVKQYGLARVPAIVVLGEKDYGIRFYGVPAGYEFASLLEAILAAGRRDHGLPPAVVAELTKIDQPVHLQVMVTPTCPYCASSVVAAHRIAMASEHVTADMVEVSEYPQVAVRYGVQGVPKTVINESHDFVGAQPVPEVVKAILKAIGR